MAVDLSNVQSLAKADLVAAEAFTGLTVLCELDEEATPDELAAITKAFDTALLSSGIAITILLPQLEALDAVRGGGVSTNMVVPIAICENPEVNRGEADVYAVPPRSPANKSASRLLEAAVAALLPHFEFTGQFAGRPEFAEGFVAHTLLARRKHLIRAP